MDSSPPPENEESAAGGRGPSPTFRPALAVLALCALFAPVALLGADRVAWLTGGVACALIAGMTRRRQPRPTRVAIVGGQSSMISLMQEFENNDLRNYELVGWIAPGRDMYLSCPLPRPIGHLGDVACTVRDHDLGLLVLGPDVPRLAIFDELLAMAASKPIRALELSAFYEQAFGHIPVADINSAWFQCIMHPRFRPGGSPAKRVFDIVVAMGVGLLFMPLLLVSALLIKLDGGPVLYRQRRIGERGQPFSMFKLRTMHVAPESAPQQWCSQDDPRITGVGSILRRLHLDELPQLYNVLRGEMSMVGPRPEQPEIVTRLEHCLAFYSRRHMIKPGLAGWAQIRCGYARSESGSAWKLCHDLYYLKHQSLRFDAVILIRTVVTLASRRSAELGATIRMTQPAADSSAADSSSHRAGVSLDSTAAFVGQHDGSGRPASAVGPS